MWKVSCRASYAGAVERCCLCPGILAVCLCRHACICMLASSRLLSLLVLAPSTHLPTAARLHELFVDYASFGASKQRLEELDSARFIKLCRECDLLCRRFTTAHADVAFTAAKKRKELRRWGGWGVADVERDLWDVWLGRLG